jgi:serine/threonine protein kinase
MAVTAEMHSDALPEGDDELRTLMSAILSNGYKEEIYLSDVSSICRRKPESAGALRELIDRYHRLGRMPAEQHQKIQARIEQTVAARAPVPRADTRQRSQQPPAARGDDGYPFEDLTCELGAEPLIAPSARGFHREIDSTPTLERPPPRVAVRAAPVPRLTARTAPAPRARATAAAATPAAPIAKPMPATPTATVPEPAIAVGRVLHDRYELQLLLGRGGMASVYKAIDRDRVRFGLADCFVALKVAPPNASRPASQAALGQEFQSAQRPSHPNVVNVFDIDHDGDTIFYTMELLAGARLSQVLRRVDGTVLQQRYALAIIRDIGAAVAHAHSRGVVHADLKPSNVMITHEGEVRVLDFGGQSMPTREPWVSEGDADEAYHPATPAYASCEQLERRRADPRDDIYALACIAYLLLAGRHPFDHLPSIEARSRGMHAHRPAGVSFAQWRVLRRGLVWGREQQPKSIESWLAKLGLDGAARCLPSLPELTAAVASRRPWRRAAALALPLLAVGAGAWALQSQANVDWNRTLSAAVSSAQDTLHEAWQAVQSLASNSVSSSAPADPVNVPATPPAALPGPAKAVGNPELAVAPAKGGQIENATALAGATAASTISTTTPHVIFAAQSYTVADGEPAARIVVQRVGNTEGELSFVWWTEPASAEPDMDYASLGRRIEHMASGQDKLTVYVPIISNPLRTQTTQFHVALGDAGSPHADGSSHNSRATVTIERGG